MVEKGCVFFYIIIYLHLDVLNSIELFCAQWKSKSISCFRGGGRGLGTRLLSSCMEQNDAGFNLSFIEQNSERCEGQSNSSQCFWNPQSRITGKFCNMHMSQHLSQ